MHIIKNFQNLSTRPRLSGKNPQECKSELWAAKWHDTKDQPQESKLTLTRAPQAQIQTLLIVYTQFLWM